MIKARSRFSRIIIYMVAVAALPLAACSGEKGGKGAAPWVSAADSTAATAYDLDQIVAGGEMIMLTLSGPDTYYDYRGRQLGRHFMLCQRLADRVGVRLRVDVCRDTAEMLRRLVAGEGDLVAFPLPKSGLPISPDSLAMIAFCPNFGGQPAKAWAVNADNKALAEAINRWYKPQMMAEAERDEARMLGSGGVRRRVHAPMLNRKGGVISPFDALFATYCQPIRWDWRLMAAQCYQESTFDPMAVSWAGARGLMQIMPATAEKLGLPEAKLHDPESNIAAAARYLGQLESQFSDIASRTERINFALASYNGGYHHIRDAIALARRNGSPARRWADVAPYVLKLETPEGYNHPAVAHGYMRGSETVDYVARIRQRWQSYRGVKSPRGYSSPLQPRKAKREKKRYTLKE